MINTYRASFITYIFIGFCLLLNGCSETMHNWKPINKYKIIFNLTDKNNDLFNTDHFTESFRIYCYNSSYELLEWKDFDLSPNEKDFSINGDKLMDEKDLFIYAVTLDELADLDYPEWNHSFIDFTITNPSSDYYEAISPIYSGFQFIRNNNTNSTKKINIPMLRRVGNVKITLFNPELNKKHIYEAEIQNISAQLNFPDIGSDTRLNTIIPFYNDYDNQISTEKLTIFPTAQNNGLVIIIRENGQIIWSIDCDDSGKPFQCNANELLEISLHLNSLSASVTVQPWENIQTDIEI